VVVDEADEVEVGAARMVTVELEPQPANRATVAASATSPMTFTCTGEA
jgi:hypothetical protein